MSVRAEPVSVPMLPPKLAEGTFPTTIEDDPTFVKEDDGILPSWIVGFQRNVLESRRLLNGLASILPNAYSFVVFLL